MQTAAEDVKELAMETEPSEQKKKHSSEREFDLEVTGTQKTPGKLSEKKRRRSQAAEESESDVPSKIRKTSESESREREKDGAQSRKYSHLGGDLCPFRNIWSPSSALLC